MSRPSYGRSFSRREIKNLYWPWKRTLPEIERVSLSVAAPPLGNIQRLADVISFDRGPKHRWIPTSGDENTSHLSGNPEITAPSWAVPYLSMFKWRERLHDPSIQAGLTTNSPSAKTESGEYMTLFWAIRHCRPILRPKAVLPDSLIVPLEHFPAMPSSVCYPQVTDEGPDFSGFTFDRAPQNQWIYQEDGTHRLRGSRIPADKELNIPSWAVPFLSMFFWTSTRTKLVSDSPYGSRISLIDTLHAIRPLFNA